VVKAHKDTTLSMIRYKTELWAKDGRLWSSCHAYLSTGSL